jgi:hypothetical protein
MEVSDLGGEPWAGLLDALIAVRRGDASAGCVLFAEPGSHVLVFDRVESGLRVRVGWGPDESLSESASCIDDESLLRFDESEPLEEVVRAVTDEARRLLELVGESGYERDWGAPFPVERLRQVEDLLSDSTDVAARRADDFRLDAGVPSLAEITEIEDRFVARGEPTLEVARVALLRRWEDGSRDRETRLRLLFLIWDACSHPTAPTGLTRDPSHPALFTQIYDQLVGDAGADPEVMFVVGWMTATAPNCCGAVGDTDSGQALADRYAALPEDQKLTAEEFAGRGAYGDYFTSILTKRQHWWFE